jgi:hypothetical protein
MPLTWWMDKENVVYVHNRVLFTHKEEWNYNISGKWSELEIIMLNKDSEGQKSHVLPHMQNLGLKYKDI